MITVAVIIFLGINTVIYLAQMVGRFCNLGRFGECALVPVCVTVIPFFTLAPVFGTVVPFFAPSVRIWGAQGTSAKPPFWKPPFCTPPKFSRHTYMLLAVLFLLAVPAKLILAVQVSSSLWFFGHLEAKHHARHSSVEPQKSTKWHV